MGQGQNEIQVTLVLNKDGFVTGLKSATGETLNFNKSIKESSDGCLKAGQSVKGLVGTLSELTLGFVTVKTAADAVKASFGFMAQIETASLGVAASFMTAIQFS